MASAWKVVQRVLDESDIVLEVLDARFPYETRNKGVERQVAELQKPLIVVLNKSDLLQKSIKDVHIDAKFIVFVSAKKNLGTTRLRNLLRRFAKGKELIVGIVGYPNTGKSSLINVLKQRRSARTSPVAGFTKGMQKIRIEKKIYMLDTPGIFSAWDYDKEKHAMTGTVAIAQLQDPDLAAMKILREVGAKNPYALEEVYHIMWKDDLEAVLADIALHLHFLMKGGKPDVKRAARKVIDDWQQGKLRIEGSGSESYK